MPYFFIINPNAGHGRAHILEDMVHSFFRDKSLHYEVAHTTHRGHATELSHRAILGGFTDIIACGGDGTIREVAEPLIGKTNILGIIPLGSGNGLTRNLYIPLSLKAALKGLTEWSARRIDVGLVNSKPFFCAAGVGLDAEVAHIFNNRTDGRRGILPYVYHSGLTFLRYTPKPITLIMNGNRITASPLVTGILNGRQYGGGAEIAPNAVIDDGKLDVVIIKKTGLIKALAAVPDIFSGRLLRHTDMVTSYLAPTLELECDPGTRYHLDGEDFVCDGPLKFSTLHRALNVRAPSPFRG